MFRNLLKLRLLYRDVALQTQLHCIASILKCIGSLCVVQSVSIATVLVELHGLDRDVTNCNGQRR